MNRCESSDWRFFKMISVSLISGCLSSSSRSPRYPGDLIAFQRNQGEFSGSQILRVSPKNIIPWFVRGANNLEETSCRIASFFFEVMRILHRLYCALRWFQSVSIEATVGGGFIFKIFTPIPGKMIQFDKCFSTGLEPPTKKSLILWWPISIPTKMQPLKLPRRIAGLVLIPLECSLSDSLS